MIINIIIINFIIIIIYFIASKTHAEKKTKITQNK